MNIIPLCIGAAVFAAFQTCPAAQQKKYVPKIVIDTLIQQAFVQLNAVTDGMPGSDAHRDQAIAAAKKVVSHLKNTAIGDPNERYILWKTGELESQIFLEERDIVLKQLEKRQKESNAVIAVFNAELGKKRPDFTVLKQAMDNMNRIDNKKAPELRRSFDQRSANISREVVYTLEKALLRSDPTIMQAEFEYCRKNRAFLQLTPEAYNRFETRIRAQSEAIKQSPVIDEQLAGVESCLARKAFGGVRAGLAEIHGILARIETDLPPATADRFLSKIKKYTAAANRLEDSLTSLTYAICAKNGENAALDYLERTLRPMGVSETKLGETSMSLMRIAASRTKTGDTALDKELKALALQQGGDDNFTELRAAAKKKAQLRADSVFAVEEEKIRRHRREQDRVDSIAQAEGDRAQTVVRAEKEKADRVTIEIYTLIEENKSDAAYRRFLAVQKPLEKYLVNDAFVLLTTTVLQSYVAQLLDKSNRAEKRATGAQAQQSKPDLDKARQVTSQIYGMLEAKNTEGAYQRFCEVRIPLEKYSDPEAFTVLETSVLQSYEAMLIKRTSR